MYLRDLKIIFFLLFVGVNAIGQEICDNGIDDDQDGYIDFYDEDCNCIDSLFQAQCPNECEILDSFSIDLSVKWISQPISSKRSTSNLTVDPLDNAIYIPSAFTDVDSVLNGIVKLNLLTGDLLDFFVIEKSIFPLATSNCISIDPITNNTHTILKNSLGHLFCIDESGLIVWSSTSDVLNFQNTLIPKVSDINLDGIPEIYTGNVVMNYTNGNILYNGKGSSGCNFLSTFDLCSLGSSSISGDFTPSFGLELACGNEVLELEINNLNDSIGNVTNTIIAPSPVLDGYTSMGDIDTDGLLDVVVVRSNQNSDGGVWVWNPITQNLICTGIAYERGGIPTITNINNDCYPEIIIAFRNRVVIYGYDNTPVLKELLQIDINDDSGSIGTTIFDLNSDGNVELIFRDEDYLKVVSPISGITIDSFEFKSGTFIEAPVITDVDNDGHAEILVTGYVTSRDTSFIYCFESANQPWAPARRVWNQTGYHVTNVNDDLTIPQYQQSTTALFDTDSCFLETCPQVYNTFGVQATYRTQKGCQVFPEGACPEPEICDNGIDDDLDGYIDFYDEDCFCNDSFFQAQCTNECEIIEEPPALDLQIKWISEPITTDYNSPNIVFDPINNQVISVASYAVGDSVENGIALLNASNGVIDRFIHDETSRFSNSAHISIFKESGSPNIKILRKLVFGQILSTSSTSDFNWLTNSNSLTFHYTKYLKLADINQDGNSELYSGNKILNPITGKLLYNGQGSAGCNFFSNLNLCSNGASSIAGDFTSSPGLEIACGNEVIEVSLNNLNDTLGNLVNIITAPSPVLDGFTSMGDINGDGLLDAVVIRSNQNFDGGIWVWTPSNQTIIASASFGDFGGIATIVDLDNDCFPEIIVTSEDDLNVYSYNMTSSLELKYTISIDDGSGSVGVTTFDFNKDENPELIFRDEDSLYIANGITGEILISHTCKSVTGQESPIVTDVDNDGHAEILVNGYINSRDTTVIFCFESANEPWPPARRVWNQTGYHVTNVNDDLTIPQYQQSTTAFFDTDSCLVETCPQVYNTFGVQVTYRTQKGCQVFPDWEQDFQITATASCNGDSTEICLHIISLDTAIISQGVPVACYPPPWENGADMPLDQVIVTEDTTCISYLLAVGIDSIMIVVNDQGGVFPPSFPNTSLEECDYTNNTFVLYLDDTSIELDLGPDIIRCSEEDTVTLIAPGGFDMYEWSDSSNDTLYVTTDDGLHFVEVMDSCGNFARDTVIVTTINNLFLLPDEVSIDLCEGDSIILFPASFDYDSIFWFQNQNEICEGCDSLIVIPDTDLEISILSYIGDCSFSDTLQINVLPTYQDTLDVSICEGDSTEVNSQVFKVEGEYIIPDQTVSGCDSTIVLNLVVNAPDTLTETFTSCEGDSIEISGVYYFKDTLLQFENTNTLGCDSLTSYTLSFFPSFSDTLFISTCNGDSTEVNGMYFKEEGVFPFTNQSIEGCDSTLFVDVTIYPTDTIYLNEEICEGDSVLFGALYYDSDTLLLSSELDTNGCDSITEMSITVVEVLSDTSYVSVCAGDSIEIFGEYRSEAGSYSLGYVTTSGCDSNSVMILTVDTISLTSLSDMICEGDSVEFGDVVISISGDYQDTLQNSMGCDSIIELSLTVMNVFQDTFITQLCTGDSFDIETVTVSRDTSFSLPFTSIEGCDSMVYYDITFGDVVVIDSSQILCWGDSLFIGDSWVYSDTMWVDTLSDGDCYTVLSYVVTTQEREMIRDTAYYCFNDSVEVNDNFYSIRTTVRYLQDSTSLCSPLITTIILPNEFPSTIALQADTTIVEGSDFNVMLDEGEGWQIRKVISTTYLGGYLVASGPQLSFNKVQQNDTISVLYYTTGCEYIDTFLIHTIPPEPIITLPNIFSPNGDNINDLWTVDLTHFPQNELIIFDRWGSKVAHFYNETYISWDGIFKGDRVSQGVYVVLLRYRDQQNVPQMMVKDITVIR